MPFKFSIRNYYLLLSIFVIGIFAYSWATNSFKPIILFAIFAIGGVFGEALVSFWWQMFFGQRLWTYNTETIYHKYTSRLNFIPWGVGGYLYLIIAKHTSPAPQDFHLFTLFLLIFPILVIFQKIIFNLFKPYPNFKFHN